MTAFSLLPLQPRRVGYTSSRKDESVAWLAVHGRWPAYPHLDHQSIISLLVLSLLGLLRTGRLTLHCWAVVW